MFAAPRIACWYIVKHSHELIGRKLEIKKIIINYFIGTFRIHEVKLYESDSKTVFLSLKQYKIDPAALQEIRLGIMEPSPDEKNLKSVNIIADILNKKPGLNIDFYYCTDHSKEVDSLSYMMTLKEYINNNKNSGLKAKNVPDSSLINYILTKSSSADLRAIRDLKIYAEVISELKSLTQNLIQ
jgi:hypothetical protein